MWRNKVIDSVQGSLAAVRCHTDMCASLGELNNLPGGSRRAPTGQEPILR